MGPPVTVFVGNITEKWPDAMIRQLLATCGHVLNWKRVQGASGKLQGFGFCEFNGPDAGLRAVRLLHDIEVGDKKLVVKVDAKTSTVLEEFKGMLQIPFA
jgi:RNA-binding protein 25